MRKPKGFTLIELLVVIAIIALLLAILMPSLKMAKEHGKRLICGTNMKTIGTALAIYAQQEDDELPMAMYQHYTARRKYSNPVSTYFLGSYDAALETASASERLDGMITSELYMDTHHNKMMDRPRNLGYLMKENLIEAVPQVVYCMSNKSNYSYEYYGGDDDWPRARGGAIRTSYSYLPQSRTKKHPGTSYPQMRNFPDQAYKYSQMDPTRSVVLDLFKGKQLAHRSGSYSGCNVLYGDGSVSFNRDDENVLTDRDLIEAGNQAGEPWLWREAIKVLE